MDIITSGLSQRIALRNDSKTSLAKNDASVSSRPSVGPRRERMIACQGPVSHMDSKSSFGTRSANSQSQERRGSPNREKVNEKNSNRASSRRKKSRLLTARGGVSVAAIQAREAALYGEAQSARGGAAASAAGGDGEADSACAPRQFSFVSGGVDYTYVIPRDPQAFDILCPIDRSLYTQEVCFSQLVITIADALFVL